MTLKEMIIKRKSIRKIDSLPLDAKTLSELSSYVRKVTPLFTATFSFKIIDKQTFDATTGGKYKISAPHYLMFYSEKKPDALKNIGYVGELFCLECTRLGIGTCWLGGTTSEEESGKGLPFIVCIAFGNPNEAFRKDAGEAKRKSLKEIAEGYSETQKETLAYVRLSPSAVNFQPWYFVYEGNKVHVYLKPTAFSFIAVPELALKQHVDIGIALAHFTVQKFSVTQENKPRLGKKFYECTLIF